MINVHAKLTRDDDDDSNECVDSDRRFCSAFSFICRRDAYACSAMAQLIRVYVYVCVYVCVSCISLSFYDHCGTPHFMAFLKIFTQAHPM